jgi:adenine-specific DNA-methyltransferase
MKYAIPKQEKCISQKKAFEQLLADNRIVFGVSGDAAPQRKRFWSEAQERGEVVTTLWRDTTTTTNGTTHLASLLGKGIFSNPKPEGFLQRIVELSTKPNDLVLDFFSGSGTTAAVAHKMNRRWIAIEQMDYIHDLPESRLIKVIQGEQGGISKAVKWEGGGSFVYCELAEANERFMRRIRDAETTPALGVIWHDMQKKGFLSYKVAEKDYPQITADLGAMAIPDQQKFLIEMLDKNLLYIPQSEIEDVDHGFSADDIRINHAFFGKRR